MVLYNSESRIYRHDITIDVFGCVKVSYHHLSLPGSHYNLCVSYIGLAEVWQKFFYIPIYSDYHFYSGCFVF